MAGCVPCFVLPLLLFIFHRYIQPILLKFWNPWEKPSIKEDSDKKTCEFSCDCKWSKKKEEQAMENSNEDKLKTS